MSKSPQQPPNRVENRKMSDKRTSPQNRSLHKWLKDMATSCNQQGVSPRVIIDELEKRGADIIVTKEFMKEVFKGVMKKMYPKLERTTQLKKGEKQIDNIVMVINKVFSQWGVSESFPSEEERAMKEYYDKN
jgi:hypothetical protein